MSLIGITATRALDDTGRGDIVALLSYLNPEEDAVIVGGCVGGDAFAGEVAKTMGLKVHVVLPEDDSQVDPIWVNYAATWELGGPYRERNERIVALADAVWAFPNHATQKEDPRSGTWMTINLARRAKKLVYLKPQHAKAAKSTDVAAASTP
jgi:hypothetical protein